MLSLLETQDFIDADIIGIDEAQFFSDLKYFILKAEKTNKIIIIAGLDGDFKRNPFGQILECIPLCDNVIKLSAMCMESKDGTPGIFTKRIIKSNKQTLIGAQDSYVAVCREKYLSS